MCRQWRWVRTFDDYMMGLRDQCFLVASMRAPQDKHNASWFFIKCTHDSVRDVFPAAIFM